MGRREQILDVDCPACGSRNVLVRWRAIDLAADAGLAERIATHRLNQTRCIQCARWIPEPPGTLLLLLPQPTPSLVFSSTFGHPSTTEERGATLELLRTELGPRWDDAWLERVLVIERYLLPALLAGGSGLVAELQPAIVALLQAKFPMEVPAVLDSSPLLLTPLAIAAVEALAEVQSASLRARGATVVAFLRDCCISSVDDALRDCHEPGDRFQPLADAVNQGEASPQTRARAIARGELLHSMLPADHPGWRPLTVWLAEQLVDTPETRERAISLYAEALAATPEDEPTGRASLSRCLGHAFHDRREGDLAGNLERAIAFFDASIALEPDAGRRALALIHRSVLFSDRPSGDRAQNVERAIEDLADAREMLDADTAPARYAHLMHNLGNLYQMRLVGEPILNTERALWAYQIALERWPADHAVDRARTECALAGVHLNRKVEPEPRNLEASLGYARASLRELSDRHHPADFLAASVTLGLALAAAHDAVDAAIETVADALGATGDTVPPAHRAHALTQLAFLFQKRASAKGRRDRSAGDVDRAAAALRAALDLDPRNVSPHARYETLTKLADLYFDHARFDEAVTAYAECESLLPTLEVGFSRAAWRAHWSGSASAGVRHAYALARCGSLEAAVLAIERVRARELRETLGRRHPDLSRLKTLHPEAHRRFVDAAEHLEALQAAERQRSMQSVQGMGIAAPEGVAADWAETRTRFDEALRAIVTIPGFEHFLASPEIDDVWAVVEPDRPLAYLATTTAGSLALLLQRAGARGEIVPVFSAEPTAAQLQRLLVRWPKGGLRGEGHYEVVALDPQDPDRMALDWTGEQPAGGYLHAQIQDPTHLTAGVRAICEAFAGLMERLTERLDDAESARLQLVPTGKLGLLPLHAALPGAMRGRGALPVVHYAPSAAVLQTLRSFDREKAALPARLAGIANPLPQAVALRFASFELDCITERFPPGTERTLRNFGATREAVLELLSANDDDAPPTYWHMACHGRFDISNALDSELLLAGGQELELVELFDRDLSRGARLVTLSACQTAVTDINAVPDEVGSLATGFLAAGATGVVATLWAVNDLASALLFTRFYRELLSENGARQVEPAIALARAQSWLRTASAGELRALFEARAHTFEAQHGKANPLLDQTAAHFARMPADAACYADPKDWAAFVYVGA